MAQQQTLGEVASAAEWHRTNPRRWGSEQRIAGEVLREVECKIENGKAIIDGTFDIRSTHGYVYESVRIRIRYPGEFSDGQAPAVILLSHRDTWKPIPDAHINSDWSLCLYVPGDSGIDFAAEDSLNALLAVVQSFLFKEWRFQKELAKEEITREGAIWPGPARPHGLDGVREAICETRPGRNSPCLCGSGKKFKVCCIKLQ